jgi:hypothetical protein
MEKGLKITVLSCLEQLQSAIRDYQILGAKPIVSAVNNAMACAIDTAHVKTDDASTMDSFRATVDYAAKLDSAGPSEVVRILKQIEADLKKGAAPRKGQLPSK